MRLLIIQIQLHKGYVRIQTYPNCMNLDEYSVAYLPLKSGLCQVRQLFQVKLFNNIHWICSIFNLYFNCFLLFSKNKIQIFSVLIYITDTSLLETRLNLALLENEDRQQEEPKPKLSRKRAALVSSPLESSVTKQLRSLTDSGILLYHIFN